MKITKTVVFVFLVWSIFQARADQPASTTKKISISDSEFKGKFKDKTINKINENRIVYREMDTGESNIKKLYAINSIGQETSRSPLFTGDFKFSKAKSVYLIWGHELDSREEYAYIWKPLLDITVKIKQDDNPINAGMFDDGEFFWIQFYFVDKGKDAIRIRVFDIDGKPCDEKTFTKPQSYVFNNIKKYKIFIPKPVFPY